MKRLHLLALLPLLLAAPVAASEIPFPEHKDGPAIVPTPPKPGSLFSLSPGPRPGFAGYYMAGRHAQADEDWHAANYYLDITARKDPLNIEIKRRAMVIALGIGDMENAASLAQDVTNLTPDDSLAAFILGVKSVQEKDYEAALQKFTSMKGGLAEFAAPLVCVWIKSAKGTFDLSGLNPDQPLSAFHAALIGKALHKEDQALEFVSAVQKKSSLEASLKIADALLVLGQDARAKELYLALQKEQDTAPLRERLAALSSPEKSQALPFMKPLTPAEGAALALLDMAKIMSAQGSIDGARIFSQLSLALAEDQPEAHILLAAIYSETGHFDEALAQYANIAPTSRYAVDVQIRTATILESLGRTTDAIKNLEDQYKIHPAIDLLIQIGDIQRRAGNYKGAVTHYDRVLNSFKQSAPDNYWYLYYISGMAQEQIGNWKEAERNFKKALEYRPNDPYVLNYLAYGWTERNMNLGKALEYLEKASVREPQDGHIKDSLGWALYKLGRFADAIGPLEKAISYLPYDSVVNEHLGDTYWRVGRKREALFQWQRALNMMDTAQKSRDDTARLEKKILSGLSPEEPLKAAENKVMAD